MVRRDTVPLTEQQRLVRDSIRKLCADFDAAYWRECDATGTYPREYDVERYFREARLTRLVPITQQLALNYVGETSSASRARTDDDHRPTTHP